MLGLRQFGETQLGASALTTKSARSLEGRDFLLRKKRDALNCPLDFIVRL